MCSMIDRFVLWIFPRLAFLVFIPVLLGLIGGVFLNGVGASDFGENSLFTYQALNSRATWLAERIRPLLPPVCRITVDERTDKLIFLSSEKSAAMIMSALKNLDQGGMQKQVYIETMIIETVLGSAKDYGIQWEARRDLRPSYTKNITTSIRTNLPSSTEPGGTVNIGTLTNDDFTIMASAMQKRDDVNVISSPRILAMSGEEAKILVGSRIPFVETKTAESVVNRNVNFLETGIRLKVVPFVEGNWIRMNIHPEVSSFSGWSPTDNQPIVQTREADTVVALKSGHTVVIGGLIRENTQVNSTKVPALGDLPLIGGAFRRRKNEKIKTEMTVFLTPTIIEDNSQKDNRDALIEKGRIEAVRGAIREYRIGADIGH